MSVRPFEPLGIGEGTRIAERYDIIRKLGSGAMSAVYKAVDRSLDNDIIALKLFESKLTRDSVLVERFQKEVLITRKLTHENIVRTFDFGQTKVGNYFMTMEYVSGTTLEQIIHNVEYTPSFPEVIHILYQIARAIGYASDLGVIHRDLKPANVLISKSGDIKLADFGLALSTQISKRLTQTGECVGTPYYMAPEQIKNDNTDQRVDVYALGIIAYELVLGHVPFQEENWYELASQIIKQPMPALESKKGQIPEWFQEFVKKATEKKKEDRFENAHEMMKELEHHLAPGQRVRLPMDTKSRIATGRRYNPTLLQTRQSPQKFNAMRLVPGIMFLMILLTVGIIAVALSDKAQTAKVTKVTSGIQKSAKTVKQWSDTMQSLQKSVLTYMENQEKFDKFLEQQEQKKTSEGSDAIEENPIAETNSEMRTSADFRGVTIPEPKKPREPLATKSEIVTETEMKEKERAKQQPQSSNQ